MEHYPSGHFSKTALNQADQLNLCQRVHRILMHENNIQLLLQSICNAIGDSIKPKECWLQLFATDTDNAYFARTGILNSNVQPALNSVIQTPCIRHIRQRGALWEPERCKDCPIPDSEKTFCCLRLPISLEGKTIGALGINLQDPERPEESLINLLADLSEDIGHAVDLLRTRVELKRQKEISEEALKVKNQFLSIVSHELITPLNPITSYCEILLNDESLGESNLECVEEIRNAAELLEHTVHRLMKYVSFDSHAVQSRFRKIPVLKLLQDLSQQLDPKHKTIKWHFQNGFHSFLPLEFHDTVNLDVPSIQQALEEIIFNAFQGLQEGSVSMLVGKDANDCIIEIQDTGSGMDAGVVNSINRAFRLIEQDLREDSYEYGLSLAVTYKIVNAHRGQLSVQSESGQGKCISIRLPLELSSPVTPTSESVSSSGPKNFLVIEDNDSNAMIIQMMLERMGAKVTRVNNGKNGVQIAQKSKFDLIVTDLHMPYMDGFIATELIKSTSTYNRDTPFLAISADNSKRTMEKCVRSGIDNFISKPVKFEPLQDCIQELLSQHT